MPFSVASDAVTKAFQNLGNEWALVSFGDQNNFNAMTISWGSLGFIWQRPIVTVLVRPVRYTYEFSEKFDRFSVSFYDRRYRPALGIMGTKSGRDGDKVALAGLTPTFIDGVPSFAEASLTVVARTVYRGQLASDGFLDPTLDAEFYPQKDHHTLYYGEILQTVEKN